MRTLALLAMILCMFIVGCAPRNTPTNIAVHPMTSAAPTPATLPATRPTRSIDTSIQDGLSFLLREQNKDGSWGTGTETHGNEVLVGVPGSHHAFRSAVTALAVMALRESQAAGLGDDQMLSAHTRAVEFLVSDRAKARRDDSMLMYNIWAHTYVVQALSLESHDNPDPRIRETVIWHIDRLKRYETIIGGWNYYDFNAGTQKPSMGPTSFGTAAGLVALWDAQQAGFDVPQRMIDLAVRRLDKMRTPSGAYLYSSDHWRRPVLPANLVRGSIGRMQACNVALDLWHEAGGDRERALSGLRDFFTNHRAIEMGRKRPYPHEAWYQTSGYYFYFGHYYAARLMEHHRASDGFSPDLAKIILERQEPDGSWWDYAMWDYHKPYGTSYAIMTLLRCRGGTRD